MLKRHETEDRVIDHLADARVHPYGRIYDPRVDSVLAEAGIWLSVLARSLCEVMRLRERYQDWDRGPFTGESQDRISAYEVTAALAG